jgi:hypothetical protein
MNNKQKHGFFIALVIILFLIESINPLGHLPWRPVFYHWFDMPIEWLQWAGLVAVGGISWVLLFREKDEPWNNKQKNGVFIVILILLATVFFFFPLGDDWDEKAIGPEKLAGLVAVAGISWVLLFRKNKVK